MSIIKNLVVNGCSFTDERYGSTWATFLAQTHSNLNYHNMGRCGAGNRYICNSTIQFLESQNFNPAETIVIIMWSAPGRIDLDLSSEWWNYLYEKHPYGIASTDTHYYLLSGGINHSNHLPDIREIFKWGYKLSDQHTLCLDSLMYFINLENYLKIHGYQYQFTSFVNYWNPLNESSKIANQYSIPYFCNKHKIYQNYKMTNWFFVNDQRDCLAEFSIDINELDHTTHPTVEGHRKFAEQIVLPMFENLLDSCVAQPRLHIPQHELS
jgi:hypothetical protein